LSDIDLSLFHLTRGLGFAEQSVPGRSCQPGSAVVRAPIGGQSAPPRHFSARSGTSSRSWSETGRYCSRPARNLYLNPA